jgi:hypothetical protein
MLKRSKTYTKIPNQKIISNQVPVYKIQSNRVPKKSNQVPKKAIGSLSRKLRRGSSGGGVDGASRGQAALAGDGRRWQVTGGTGRGLAGDGRRWPGLARGDGSQARSSTGWRRKEAALGAARRLWQVLGEAGRGWPGRGGAAVTDPTVGAGARRGRPVLARGGGWRWDPAVGGGRRRPASEEAAAGVGIRWSVRTGEKWEKREVTIWGKWGWGGWDPYGRGVREWGAGVGFGRVRPCRVVNLESSFSTGQGSEALFGWTGQCPFRPGRSTKQLNC